MATSMIRIPLYKVILVGEVGVGKSSVYTRFKKDFFNPLGTPTLGVDSFTEQVLVDGEHCKLYIWDTAGLERTGSLTSHYYHAAHAVLLMYSVEDLTSLNMISHWIEDVEHYASYAIKFLVGNKSDVDKDDWEVSEDKAQKFVEGRNFVEKYCVSAKTGDGIKEMFDDIARHLMKHQISPSKPMNDAFHPSTEESLDLRQPQENGSCYC
ncbi:GTP-binding protein ypt2 [Exaiptasia diaphana]|uniref:Uncharacterized protein n=1 Tax=Exaiptasia diaphana TaxID=2652724 RepID=A0A913Y079_EXADI|nr:GTP-binding protein ypt2 [Exaiptasia diaphana]